MSELVGQTGDALSSLSRRIAATCLALVIITGSAGLWIGVPLLGFWAGGQLTSSAEGFLFFVLGGVPLAMVLVGWALYRVNGLYEGLRGSEREADVPSAWLTSVSEERAEYRRRRGPRPLIDVAMTASAVTALVLMVVWFFFLAEMRLVNPL
jgi:hypothetical protein